MSEPAWEQAKAMFLRLRDRSPTQRAEILDRELDASSPIRREVESLLAHHDGAEGFLERSALDQIDATGGNRHGDNAADDPRVGETIGRFRIIRRIAAGGMGTVYEAEQDSPRRRVALKLLRREYATGVNARRFTYESQILAHLRHEGIAAVFDAGTHVDHGVPIPYFAMEYLSEAKSITRFANDDALPLRDRLRLFVAVCDAVHFGHQHGVIHRDLKPANILVDAGGRPKVIDFGVARTVDSDIASVTIASEAGHLLGTPQYMSPEQFDANPHAIDTRSDVYSLGVVLFELITGQLPYEVDHAPIASIAQIVRTRPARRLSSVNRKLSGDLQTIVATAMEKEPDRRYPSAADLARDIERYLDDCPILARPSSMAYQARKFARRHPAIVASFGVAVTALIAASVISARYAYRAAEAGKREAIRAAEATMARDAESAARALAERRHEEAEFQAYVANIAAAAVELRAGGVAEAKSRLDNTKPQLREWEYGYLERQLDDSDIVLRDPRGAQTRVRFSPDGRRLATSVIDTPGEGGSQHIYAFDGLKEIAHVDWDRLTAGNIAFHPDGRRFAVCGDDRVEIYAVEDDVTPLRRFDLPHTYISDITFTPDGRTLIANEMYGGVRTWDVETGEPIIIRSVHGDGIADQDLSPDGRWIAVASRDRRVRMFDATMERTIFESSEIPTEVGAVRFDHDGKRLAACVTNAGRIILWNTSDWGVERTIQIPSGQIARAAFSPDGSLIAGVGSFKELMIWETATGKLVGTGRGHAQHVNDVTFHPDGDWIVTAGNDNAVRVWSIEALRRPDSLHGHSRLVRGLRFSPDSRMLATCAFDGTAKLWNVADRSLVRTIPAETNRLHDVAFSIDGGTLMIAERDGIVSCWDVATGKHLRNLIGHEHSIHALAVDPRGRWTASAGIDGRIVLWRHDTGESLMEIPAHDVRINGLDVSNDGDTLVSVSTDGTAKLWRTADGTPLHTFRGHEGGVEAVRFSPDGSIIATGGDDHTIRLWDCASGEAIRTLTGHIGGVLELAFSPDGRRLVSSAYDTNVIVWDVARGAPVISLRGHDAWVWAVAFSPDGRYIASGEGPYGVRDCAVRLWDGGPD
ncbi:MAG TPA: protein kinase [Phycisphaerae bacterium]|nr:protein kinase [Phycisphaerae bacterium]HRW53786.1 protein kinase [Phycisphaerae bacterium]